MLVLQYVCQLASVVYCQDQITLKALSLDHANTCFQDQTIDLRELAPTESVYHSTLEQTVMYTH